MQLRLTSVFILDIAGLASSAVLKKRGLLVKLIKKPDGDSSTLASHAGNQHPKTLATDQQCILVWEWSPLGSCPPLELHWLPWVCHLHELDLIGIHQWSNEKKESAERITLNVVRWIKLFQYKALCVLFTNHSQSSFRNYNYNNNMFGACITLLSCVHNFFSQ